MSWGGAQWGGDASWGASAGGKGGWGASDGGKGGWGAASQGKGSWGAATQSKGSWGAAASPQVVKPSWGQADKQATGSWGQQAGKGAVAGKGVSVAPPAAPEAIKAKLAKLTTDVTCQETMTKPTLEAATKVLENEAAPASQLKTTIDSLEKHQTKLNEIKATITTETAAARKAGVGAAAVATEMSKLLVKCAELAQKVTENINKLKPKHAKAQCEATFTRQETLTKAALDAAGKALENEKATVGSIKASATSLETQTKKLTELKEALTKEVAEARKAGPSSGAVAAELSKALIKYNTLSTQVMSICAKLKFKEKRAQNEAELKAKEAKDNASFKPVLAKATAEITTAVNSVNAVSKQVDPLVSKTPEAGEELDKKIAAIEKAATEALQKCHATKSDLAEKFKTIQVFAPESKKTATASLMELQKKLTDRINTCVVYKSLKRELPKLVASQKAVAEVTEKLAGHEAQISKAEKVAASTKLTKAQVDTIDETLDPVKKAITSATLTIAQKKTVDAATQEKFAKLKARAEELQKKVDAVYTKIKEQRDVIKAQEGIDLSNEKLKAVAEAWTACQDAEMPFLTGFEVLPEDINDAALKACSEAAGSASKAISEVRHLVQKLTKDCQGYETELRKKTVEQLGPISKTVQELDTKVSNFRKESQERGVTAMVANVLGNFEKKIKAAENVGKALASSKLEDSSVESITESVEKTKAAFAEASKHADDAKKDMETKKREGKFFNNNAAAKILEVLKAGQNRLSQVRNATAAADKLVKAKAALKSGEDAMKEAEANVEKAKKVVPKEGKALSMEKIAALDEACKVATKSLGVAGGAVSAHVQHAPTKLKAELQKLLDRKKEALEVISQIKKDTKDRREETLSTHYLEEAEGKTKAVEAADGKLSEAEAPFLVGATLPLKKTQEQLAKCTEVAAAVLAAVTDARQHSNKMMGDARGFGEASLTKVKEGLAAMSERANKVKTRLDVFNKENRERTKDAKVLDCQEQVDELEATGKKIVAAAAVFEKEGADNMSEADAAAPLKAFVELDKEQKKHIDAVRRLVAESDREQKGKAEQTEILKKLQERISKASQELTEKRKVTAPHEQKALGTKLLAESKEQVAALDAEIKKATEACAALIEKGGEEFLVASSMKTLVAALKKHMKEKELDQDALIKEISKGAKMKDKQFTKYLEDLPTAIGHDELSTFTDERRLAIFKRVSASGSAVTQEDLKAMFAQRYTCIKPVAVTNQFDVEGSETLVKLETSASVQLSGVPKEDESGMLRSECTSDGKTGWITLSQKNGGKFLVPASGPFKQYCTDTDKAIHDANAAVQKASSALSAKMGQGGQAKEGSSLKQAREEMAKLKEPIAKALKEMKELQGKFSKAKGDYSHKESAERNAHIEIRNNKEAAPFLEGPTAKLAAVEAASKAAEEAAAAMVALSPEELEAFATPATVLENVEKHFASMTEKATEVREAVKEQMKAVQEVTPQSGGTAEAKKRLAAISAKLQQLNGPAAKARSQVRVKCQGLVKAKLDLASEGIRKHCTKKKLGPEKLFDSLKSGDKIPEKAFSKLLASLEGLSINAEHALLITRKLEADGISKDTFIKYVVLYYKIVKTIAFTEDFDVTKTKTLSKGVEGTVVEVLEGPTVDEATEMTRIKGRATMDGTAIEGWITVSGSKGTTYLQRTTKPAEKKATEAKA